MHYELLLSQALGLEGLGPALKLVCDVSCLALQPSTLGLGV